MSSSVNSSFFTEVGALAKKAVGIPTNVVTRMPRALLNTSRFTLKTITKLSGANYLPPARLLIEEADQILKGADKTLGLIGLPPAQRVDASDNFAGFVKQVFTGKVTEEDLDVDSPESREKLFNLKKYGMIGGTIVNKLKRKKAPEEAKMKTFKKRK